MSDVKESGDYDNFVGKKERVEKATLDVFFDGDVLPESESWKTHWQDMPEFEQEENKTYKTISVHFRTKEDYEAFAKVIGQNLSEKTKSIWHPKLQITKNSLLRWIQEDAE
jgi:hypothetical protein